MIGLAARPRLVRARLRRRGDAVLLLAPERGLLLRGSAPEVLALVDGRRTVAEIIAALARAHADGAADPGAIERDVLALFEALAGRHVIRFDPAPTVGWTEVSRPDIDRSDIDRSDIDRSDIDRSDIDRSEAVAADGPMTLIAELTYACPLRCAYCSNPIGFGRVPAALATADWLRVFREAEALGVVQLHLTGGEPLLRADLEDLVVGAHERDLYVNLITSGVPLRRERLAALRAAGLDAIQISFQDATGAGAARVAGVDRHRDKLAAAAWARELDLPLTINCVLHAGNIDEVDSIIALAEELGAERLELANTQYLGWALRNRAALLPSAEQIARARASVVRARERLAGRMDLLFVLPDHHRGRPRACMDGWARRYLVVAPDGLALPCHAARDLPLEFWTVREHGLAAIWADSPGFAAFRGEEWMAEPCRSCDRRGDDFGGCRCQAFALTGDARVADPACALAPDHDLVRLAEPASLVSRAALELRSPSRAALAPRGAADRAPHFLPRDVANPLAVGPKGPTR